MADNTTLNSGSGGDVIASDDIGPGVKYQRVKITLGADGTNDGDVASGNPMPVSDAGGSLTIDGTVTANLSATDNAVLDQIEVNTSYGDSVGGGTEAAALRVTLASDSTGVLSVDDNGGSLTVDGTVTANLSATDNAVLDQIDANTDYGAVVGGGAEATALRVTLANDSTGVVSVDDNGGSLTIDNTGITTIAGAVSGTEMQVDVVAALPAGTNAIGKLAANSGVDIGDVDVTSISAGSNLIGDVGISGARTSGGTTFTSSLGTSTLTQIKGTAGQLYWLSVINLKASVLYLQIFNKASASVTLGTTTPDLVFPLPTQGDTNGAGFNFSVPNGIAFGTGISWAITTTETGSTTAAANEAYLNAGYA